MKYYSDITKALYDTAKTCEEAEASHLKAEEERKNDYKTALAEIDALLEEFNVRKQANDKAREAVIESSNQLHKKYLEFQRKYGRLPEKHYASYILTRII